MVKIAVFAHDPGGARAILKVIQYLQGRRNCKLEIFAEGPAREIYTKAGVLHQSISKDCGSLLKKIKPHGLLSATSLSSPYDRAMISAANQLGIPSLAIVDYWGNYKRRFSNIDNPISIGLEYLPTLICSIDNTMTMEMIKEGIPEDRIIETGQPVFDDLIEANTQNGIKIRLNCRSAWEVSKDDLVLLYASQPIASFYGESRDSQKYIGFTEWEVAEILLNTLENLTANSKINIVLLLRPHPKENKIFYESIIKMPWSFRIALDTMDTPYESILGSDVVIGISSIILMEAAMMGRVAISLQPNLLGKDTLKSNISGLTYPAYTKKEAVELITSAVNNLHHLESIILSRKDKSAKSEKAAERIGKTLLKMIEKNA